MKVFRTWAIVTAETSKASMIRSYDQFSCISDLSRIWARFIWRAGTLPDEVSFSRCCRCSSFRMTIYFVFMAALHCESTHHLDSQQDTKFSFVTDYYVFSVDNPVGTVYKTPPNLWRTRGFHTLNLWIVCGWIAIDCGIFLRSGWKFQLISGK